MLTQEQIAQFIAQGVPPATIAAMMSQQQQPAAAPAPSFFPGARPADPMLARIVSAPDPTSRRQSLSHPEDTPLIDGRGMYDGEYDVTIESIGFDTVKPGQILKLNLHIDTSTNPAVLPGTTREHPLFQWVDAAIAETKGVLQMLYEARGNTGRWEQQEGMRFYYAATGETNECRGLRFHLSVATEPQVRNPRKFFSKHRYHFLGGPSAQAASASAPIAATVPPSIPGGAAHAFAATPAAATAFPPKPAGWPDILPWPPQAA